VQNGGAPPAHVEPEVGQIESRPPFPLERPTSASWREQALSKIAELRFVRDWLLHSADALPLTDKAGRTIDDHLEAAAAAAKGGRIWTPRNVIAALTGSAVERVISQLDAVEAELLRVAPAEYLKGEISSLLAHVQLHLRPTDPRRVRVETIAQRVITDQEEHAATVPRSTTIDTSTRRTPLYRSHGRVALGGAVAVAQPSHHGVRPRAQAWSDSDRQAVVSAVRAASSESRWKVSRLRSFRNVIAVTAFVLTIAAVGMVFFGFNKARALPLCFTPTNAIVCPTSTHFVSTAAGPSNTGPAQAQAQARVDAEMRHDASGWDIAVVELVGMIGAAIAAAAAIRNVQGTSTPYSLPVALAVLKLPTGALTAMLGLLLARGNFVPGLSALDSSAQIIAWALVFGYAQQLLTRLVDNQAQSVLEGAGGNTKSLSTSPVLPAEAQAATASTR
jgi:hypothetical protein